MKPWKTALAALVLLTIAGCRSDPAVPILERELRRKEDEIYRLRATLDDMQDCSVSSSDRAVNDSRPTSSEEPEARSRRSSRSENIPGVPPVDIDLGSPGSSTAPKNFDPGEKSPSGGSSNPLKENRNHPVQDETTGPVLERETGGMSARPARARMASRSASAEPFTPSGDSRQVASIVLDRILTGGISEESGSGDQGILVVVEPRDRKGRTIDAPAEMSVVVIDPAVEGDAARVARWDFTPAETAALFRRTGSSQAIHLTTVWPADPPTHNKLHLFVRYVTADGRKLQAEKPIEVALAGDKTARWNPDQEPEDNAEPRMAVRAEQTKPRRPAWSPERP
jgi:hypothetical protein